MSILRGVTLATALASVVTGGSLYAFSTLVMPVLDRVSGAVAIKSMQSINIEAPRSLLMVPLVGSILGSVAGGVYAAARPQAPNRVLLLVGVTLGVIAFVITPAYHLPHNDALATVDPNAPNAVAIWMDYSLGWTRWNHARTLAYIASGIALVTAVVRQ